MAILLFVRNWADVRFATEQVDEFFAFRRSRDGEGGGGKILAVWVRSQLEADLASVNSEAPEGGGLWIRESISLAGIWTLCWLDGPLLVRAQSFRDKRDRILEVLVNASSDLGPPGLFFPVFDRDESPESVAAEVLSLKARYPGVIGSVGPVFLHLRLQS